MKGSSVPQISVFTPSHNARYLNDCCESLMAQTFTDWEWVVLLNGDASWMPPNDPRVRLFTAPERLAGVGAAKKLACEYAVGDILVELDHDDYLLPSALAEIVQAFSRAPEAALVYSNFSQVDEKLERQGPPFNSDFGWKFWSTPVTVKSEKRVVTVTRALDASLPHTASLIWYQPNHVRAFQRATYLEVGGYDAERDVLDDQDLMNRLYRAGEFVHIDECLYLQRQHVGNTQARPDLNERIQRETFDLYDANVQPNALAWAKRSQLACLDLTPSGEAEDGYDPISVDKVFTALSQIDDSTVGVIRAVDFLQHVPEPVPLFNELHRVLAHGGMLLSLTPSTDGRGAFQNPTSRSFYNENTFWYFTEEMYARQAPGVACKFQASKLSTSYPSEWHRARGISYVNANLVALKSGPRIGGLRPWRDS